MLRETSGDTADLRRPIRRMSTHSARSTRPPRGKWHPQTKVRQGEAPTVRPPPMVGDRATHVLVHPTAAPQTAPSMAHVSARC
ncbi:MAG: hypothetical protein D6725_09805 [Planctomycetota bacterium]|nr:MAG: hypothetical protein D6725_09805 [Planctomycetota bacterium]